MRNYSGMAKKALEAKRRQQTWLKNQAEFCDDILYAIQIAGSEKCKDTVDRYLCYSAGLATVFLREPNLTGPGTPARIRSKKLERQIENSVSVADRTNANLL